MTGSEWFAREQRLLGFAALGAVIVASSVANVLMKLGARVEAPERLLFGMVAWQTLLGIASFGCGAIFYAWALKFIDVHVAQSVIAVQYIVIILLAAAFLGENVPPMQWWGMGLIAIGLFLCMR
jgi:drug/metabolite transporter (DMT)-like permease